jgi:YD repeat-containing protein
MGELLGIQWSGKNGATICCHNVYDFWNQLRSATSTPSGVNDGSLNRGYAYDQAGERTQMTQGDGSFWAYTYHAMGQVTGGSWFWGDGTGVPGEQFGYVFDIIGNRACTTTGGDQSGGRLRPEC